MYGHEETTTFDYDVKLGEVWQDAEGTLMVAGEDSYNFWYVFGVEQAITIDHPLIVHPLTRVFDQEGNVHIKKLAYPDGIAWTEEDKNA